MLRAGEVYENKINADDHRKVAFLIGAAFGKGWCPLGPLADPDSEFCLFSEAMAEDDVDDADGDDEEEEEDDDDMVAVDVLDAEADQDDGNQATGQVQEWTVTASGLRVPKLDQQASNLASLGKG